MKKIKQSIFIVSNDGVNEECIKSYIAGIYDGEGSYHLKYFKKDKIKMPCVGLSMSDKEIIDFISKYFKKWNIKHNRSIYQPKRKKTYKLQHRLDINSKNINNFFRVLGKYLIRLKNNNPTNL